MSVILPNVIMRGTFAGRPAAHSAGSLYFASDTGKQYRDNGTSWDEVTPTGSGGGSVSSVALTMPPEFSVSGSPITSTGTLVVNKATQSANVVYAGPTTGSAAAPTFRSLVAADLPTQPYDVGFYMMGKPPASVTIFKYKFPRTVAFAANFSGAVGAAPEINATATTTFTVKKNGSTVGTVAVATGGTYTFATSGGSAVSFASGDTMTYVSPAQDATLDGAGWTLTGVR